MYLLDLPQARAMAFHPRKAAMNTTAVSNMLDGTISVEDGVALGYRFHIQDSPTVIVYFHGNGEIAVDYDQIGLYYNRLVRASLLVIDYRGYGWSTGEPTFKALFSDTDFVFKALPDIFKRANISNPSELYVMGRSIGSAPAIHLASTHEDAFHGLIIESGFASLLSVLRLRGTPLIWRLPDGLGNQRKLRSLKLPLLVIHGEEDELLPLEQGRKLFEASAAANKTFVSVPHAGHNTVINVGPDRYFNALATFINTTSQ